jgi:hypothetical protein
LSPNVHKVITIQSFIGAEILKNRLAYCAAQVSVGVFYLLMPFLPLLMGVVFLKPRFIWHYPMTLGKLKIYIKALREGPVLHYFNDVVAIKAEIPPTIEGSCIKCGNCCLDKRCVFLEQTSDVEYQCGIYHSPLRRFSNCNSFPLDARDIERYACPSFTVVNAEKPTWTSPEPEYPVQWIRSNP